jgi:uncharacterized protein (TIGR02145 family)
MLIAAAIAAGLLAAGCGREDAPATNTTQNGTFTDSRDSQTYKTVKIGKQTWMAQNLNYRSEVGSSYYVKFRNQSFEMLGGSWCYNDCTSYCDKYGRLYDGSTAREVCPAGWRLPSRRDWKKLAAAANGAGTYGDGGMAGKKLKAKSDWDSDEGEDDLSGGNGTDDFGFSALPGGYRDYGGDCSFNHAGFNGYWWTSNDYYGFGMNLYINGSDLAYYQLMSASNDDIVDGRQPKGYALSVRCVQK